MLDASALRFPPSSLLFLLDRVMDDERSAGGRVRALEFLTAVLKQVQGRKQGGRAGAQGSFKEGATECDDGDGTGNEGRGGETEGEEGGMDGKAEGEATAVHPLVPADGKWTFFLSLHGILRYVQAGHCTVFPSV